MTEDGFRVGRRGADRAVLLAHGAGSDMNAPALVVVAEALAGAGVPSLRFDFPYRQSGRKAPDRAPVLESAVREAADVLARRVSVPLDRVILGGRSMGGRMCSLVVADTADPHPALGLVFLGYPLHPPGKPNQLRVEHFSRVHVPTLFVSGTRDAFGTPTELRRGARRVKGSVTFTWLESADHGFRTTKASGISTDQVLERVASSVVEWILGRT